MTRINIVIPTYNEARDLPRLVKRIHQALKDNFGIIFVDDNSPDGTAKVALDLNRIYGNIRVVNRPSKRGIGSAIVDGLRAALKDKECEIILTMDADLSHDPSEIPRILRAAEKGTDLVQGSRYIPGGEIHGWSRRRYFMSALANIVCRHLLGTGMRENTTYFRAYSRRLAEILVKDVPVLGFEFAIGSILAAKDSGMKIVEVPITFVERIHGKSKLRFKDIYRWWRYVIKTFIKRRL